MPLKTSTALRGVVVILAVAATAGLAVRSLRPPATAGDPSPATKRYLADLDVRRFEQAGTDYTNPRYSPLRLGKPLADIDRLYDYDFPALQAVVEKLDGVDRRTVLAAIFARVTDGCRTDTDRHLAVLKFLHKAGNHNYYLQPMWPDRSGVYDPLVLLELGEMRCGQVNRVGVDLFLAGGYEARLVQVAEHVAAEVFHGGGWHYFDASFGGNGECVRTPAGDIPSVADLSWQPARIDALTVDWEPDHQNSLRGTLGLAYPSWHYFSAPAYAASGVRPTVYVKTATPDQERQSIHYGWNYIRTEDEPRRQLWPDLPRRMPPTAPLITRCDFRTTPAGRQVELAWEGDRADGYVVSAGTRPRGWNFGPDGLPPALRHLKSSDRGWRPDDYEARFALPPADVGRWEVREPRARVDLPAGPGPVYLTVMAYDAHGRAAGRRVFPMSEELRLGP